MLSDIKKVKKYLVKNNLDAFITCTSDPHCSEYIADRFQTVKYFSRFTGSNGELIITKTDTYLYTDGRYFIQAEKELEGSGIILMKDGQEGVPKSKEFISKFNRIAFEFSCMPTYHVNEIKELNPNIKCIDAEKFLNNLWMARPLIKKSKIYFLNDRDAGESVEHKILRLRLILQKRDAHAILLTSLDDIAWLFNMRGKDIPNCPVNYAFAIISRDKTSLYLDELKWELDVIDTLYDKNIELKPYSEICDDLKKETGLVLYDPIETSYALSLCMKNGKAEHPTYVSHLKSTKNQTEIQNIINAHILDGIALIKFQKYLYEKIGKIKTDELSLSSTLSKFRKESYKYIMPSFDTICAFNENSAICHYEPTKESNRPVTKSGVLLVDSGGQYKFGTTDVTRTYFLSTPTDEMKHNYTLVLKAHIALANTSFKDGTTGRDLDKIAREPLIKEGKDFHHGTGHGVGYMLNVHEGPQSISPRCYPFPFLKGMVTSIEPGIYLENEYGIRLENLYLVQKENDIYHFEALTLAPFLIDAIDKTMLSSEEIDWLNNYHNKVYDSLSPYLDDTTKRYLRKCTKKLC